MVSQSVPSYEDIFNDTDNYNTLTQGLSSESVITLCIALINELTSKEEKYELQKRIYDQLSVTFSDEEKKNTDKRLNAFWGKIGLQFGVLFHRSYLLQMILIELNNNREFDEKAGSNQEYGFFKAYVRVMADVNRKQSEKVTFDNLSDNKSERKLELLWRPTISSYEFNEQPNLPFEQFKVMTFLKYAKENYPKALNEYLEINNKTSIGNLLHSFDQVNRTALANDDKARLKRLAYLNPARNANTVHLDRQCINKQSPKQFTIGDIKAFPLYLTQTRGYMVIDPNYYMRKNYYGPFFELRNQTSLKDDLKFNSYSSQVSQALESSFFQPIFTMLCEGLPGKVKVDDGTPNAPDGYCRVEKLIFVIEYKASIFPETLSQSGEVKEISAFLDKKFISSTDGKKGISQLKQKLETFFSGGYDDDKLELEDTGGKYRIFLIIVHHDFYFSLPGVNDYLSQKFEKAKPQHDKFEIMPLVVMNLSILYDLVGANLNLAILDKFFIDYYNFLQQATLELYANPKDKTDNFLAANMSFDEYYHQYILKELPRPADNIRKKLLDQLFNRAGISFAEFNNP